jgi:predicted nucleic acid-binding protein
MPLVAEFDKFLTAPDIKRLSFPPSVFERATRIRALHNYRLGDALHLAVAVDGGCDTFLTNDKRLSAFPDLTVEILP